jgi:hypothetical protein
VDGATESGGIAMKRGFCLLYTLFGIDTCKAAKECE